MDEQAAYRGVDRTTGPCLPRCRASALHWRIYLSQRHPTARFCDARDAVSFDTFWHTDVRFPVCGAAFL
ncbi:hypothetical protein D1872_178160 [compost metagenome]